MHVVLYWFKRGNEKEKKRRRKIHIIKLHFPITNERVNLLNHLNFKPPSESEMAVSLLDQYLLLKSSSASEWAADGQRSN